MLRKLLVKVLIITGFPDFIRYFLQRKRVTVICYHKIIPDSFEKQVKYISKKYNVIDLDMLLKILNGEIKIPPKSLLITFDDGHVNNYKLLGIFKDYGIKPVIFLTSALIGTKTQFWFKLPFESHKAKESLKLISDSERRTYIKQHFGEDQEESHPSALTFPMIREMLLYVDFQSHTVDHPCLNKCTCEESKYQIEQSKVMIESFTKKKVYAIAYPNGDYTEREIEISRNLGYQMGFTSKIGFVSSRTAPFEIPRLSINDVNDFHEFILRITGIWAGLKLFKSH